MPLNLAEFNITLKLVDSIYIIDQANTTQTLVSLIYMLIKLYCMK